VNLHFRNVNSILNLRMNILVTASNILCHSVVCIASLKLRLEQAIIVREMPERCVTKATMLYSLREAALHSTTRTGGGPLGSTVWHVTCACPSQACLKFTSQLGSHCWSVGG
jgi:hypothetical protein